MSERFVCDIGIGDDPGEVDFVAKSNILNYRVKTWDYEAKEGDTVKERYEIADVILMHDLAAAFQTQLHYVGKERRAWLRKVLEAIPITAIAIRPD